jgi:uncharacterized protein HemX
MHPRDWSDAAQSLNAIFGSVGTLAIVVAILAVAAAVVLWRALQNREGKQTEKMLSVIAGNTESHERNSVSHRDSAMALIRLSDTLERFGQGMRDTEEQRRHSFDLIIQQRPQVRRRKGADRA